MRFLYFIVGFLAGKFSKKEPLYWQGPKPSPEQQRAAYQNLISHVELWPDGSFSKDHPEYLEDITIGRKYDLLYEKLKNGEISSEDYDREIEKLLK